ncbi:arrestin domain-containing protein 17-like [Xenia sp. Carnegie-2017]|uniref:arrestin domain-containing protein 17-like n=1 Tax=Xenia sp. Carnegie-2017 TaxID=2897299 RepID=UPI001F03E219|nr:arrestin domain-containing protein 17-like [Xenia sp. Carnegie-2017]
MGKPDEFKIIFTNNKRVYYAGDMVTGNVVTKSRKKLKFRSIRMEFLGEARVAKPNSKDWVAVKNYFDEKVEIFGKDGSHDSSYPVISAGDHAFPFHFEIPMSHLPSSFEGKLGCIRYTLKAIMDRPWKSNYSSKSAITILEMVDINEPWALEPIIMEREMQEQFMCFNRGSVIAQLRTDRRGYCPGEAIALTGGLCNNMSKRTKPVKVILYQKTKYTQGKKITTVNKCVKVSKDKRLPPHTPVQWENQMFSIPPIPPTINNCKFIKVSYELEVCIQTRRNQLVLSLPITIGTVPYRPPLLATAPPTTLPREPSAPASDEVMPFQVNLPTYNESMTTAQLGPPPSYADCILGAAHIWDENDANSGDIMGDTSFTPMYAFVSNYQFHPGTVGTFAEEETIAPDREPRLDAVDDGLSDSMDEQSN